MTDLQAPGVFGPYELIEQLGEGSFGEVFRARPRGEGFRATGDVALKVLKPPRAGEEPGWYGRRIRAEAEALQRLQHPNIVGFRHAAVEPHSGRLYIEMEFVHGPTLGRLLRDAAGPLPPPAVAQLALQLAAGLDAAHSAERGTPIVHRDLKPDNVLVSRQGQAKIVDFGLAKSAPGGAASMSLVVGTACYVAPEQLEERGTVDARADLFALGVILTEAALGQPLFPRDAVVAMYTIRERLDAHLAERDVLNRVEQAVPGLGEAVQRLLARSPDERPASAAALEQLLEEGLSVELRADRRALRRVVREWEGASAAEEASAFLDSSRGRDAVALTEEILEGTKQPLGETTTPLRTASAHSSGRTSKPDSRPADPSTGRHGGTGSWPAALVVLLGLVALTGLASRGRVPGPAGGEPDGVVGIDEPPADSQTPLADRSATLVPTPRPAVPLPPELRLAGVDHAGLLGVLPGGPCRAAYLESRRAPPPDVARLTIAPTRLSVEGPVAVSADCRWLLTAGRYPHIVARDLWGWGSTQVATHPGTFEAAVRIPGSDEILVYGHRPSIWRVGPLRLVRDLPSRAGGDLVSVSPAGDWAVGVDERSASLRFFDLRGDARVRQANSNRGEAVALAADPAGTHAWLLSKEGWLQRWAADGGTLEFETKLGGEASAMAVSADREELAVSVDDEIVFVSLESRAVVRRLAGTVDGRSATPTDLAYSGDDRSILVSSAWNSGPPALLELDSMELRDWPYGDLELSRQTLATLPGEAGLVAFGSIGDTQALRFLWGADFQPSGALAPARHTVRAVDVDSLGHRLAVAGDTNEVFEEWVASWDLNLGRPSFIVREGCRGPVQWFDDDRRFAAGGLGPCIFDRDSPTPSMLGPWSIRSNEDYTRDAALVVANAADRIVELAYKDEAGGKHRWRLAIWGEDRSKPEATLRTETLGPYGQFLSPDGRYLYSTDGETYPTDTPSALHRRELATGKTDRLEPYSAQQATQLRAMSHDGSLFALLFRDRWFLRRASSMELVSEFEHENTTGVFEQHSVSFLEDGETLTDLHSSSLPRSAEEMHLLSLEGEVLATRVGAFAVGGSRPAHRWVVDSGDGSIAIFRNDAELPEHSFVVDGSDWFAWTPDGHWDASDNGHRLASFSDGKRAWSPLQFPERRRSPLLSQEPSAR